MSDTFNCGFARIAVKESFHKRGSAAVETDPEERWQNYLEMFDDEGRQIFAVERFTYIKRSRTIYSAFRKMKSKCRSQYQETFSAENWKALTQSQKKQHTLSNCEGCRINFFATNSQFCKGGALMKHALHKSGVKAQTQVKPTQAAITSAVRHIYSKVNGPFERMFKIGFAEAQTKVKELNLQKKQNANEKKRLRRERARQEKIKIQQEWSKKDCDTMLATRQSFAQRSKQRKLTHFESVTDAAIRVQKRKNQEALGERKPKRHSPPPASVQFDKENLLQEVENMKDGEKASLFFYFSKRVYQLF